MPMRMCTQCGVDKDLCEYYNKKCGLYGKHAECKTCMRQKQRERLQEQDRSKKHAWDAKRRARIKQKVDAIKSVEQTTLNAEKFAKYKKQCERKIKIKARLYVGTAIQLGYIIKPTICEACGKQGLLHGHHTDYGKPLEVRWLCPLCHHDKEII